MKIPKLLIFSVVGAIFTSIIALVCVLQLNNSTTTAPVTSPNVDVTEQVANQVKAQLDSTLMTAVTNSVKPLNDQIKALEERIKAAETKPTTPTTPTPSNTPKPSATPTTPSTPAVTPTPVTTKQVKVTTGLNIRTNPGLNQGITGALNNGDTVTYLNESSNVDGHNWIKVKTSSGATGWIAQEYVTDK